MHQLTKAGLSAMAEELLRLASDGQRSWDQATPQIRAEFRGFIDALVDKARDAEEERQAAQARARPTTAGAALTPTRKEPNGEDQAYHHTGHLPQGEAGPDQAVKIEKVPLPKR